MKNHLLEWEINWINNNPQHYEGRMHMNAVIQNLRKAYRLKELKRLVSQFEKTKTSKAYHDLFDFNNSMDKKIKV